VGVGEILDVLWFQDLFQQSAKTQFSAVQFSIELTFSGKDFVILKYKESTLAELHFAAKNF
jgi:hypothetical protein